ncbi:hypothetical protein [Gorillibacterium sp. sgz5001074]
MKKREPVIRFARVKANEGFKSGVMQYEHAVIYARQLEDLGNVNVEVVPA